MVNFTADQMQEVMENPENIRNISIIGHINHGKTTLTNFLTENSKINSEHKEGSKCFTVTRSYRKNNAKITLEPEENWHYCCMREEPDLLTIKSKEVSLYYEQKDSNEIKKYLINLIDSPELEDLSPEVTAAFRVTDGTLLVVDCLEGVCFQTETLLRQALQEKIRPVLMLNKVDKFLLEMESDAETIYQRFYSIIQKVNSIISNYDNGDMGILEINPVRGNVVFGSGMMGWAFSLNTFAQMYAKRFGVDKKIMLEKLWGEWHFDRESNKWSKTSKSESGKQLKRGFNQFIIEPLQKLSAITIEGNWEKIEKVLKNWNIKLKPDAKLLEGKILLKKIMKKWINASDCFRKLIIKHLPSPKESQRYRVDYLYQGPLDDCCAQAIRNCDPHGPLIIYVSKLIPTNKNYRLIGFGRIFSGTATAGQKVRIMGPNYAVGNKLDLFEKSIQIVLIMMNTRPLHISHVPCGNTIGLIGINPYLCKPGTISTSSDAYPLKNIKYSRIPIISVSVQPKLPSDLPKFVEALKFLSKIDQLVKCYIEPSGEHIIAGYGDYHIKNCLRELKEYSKIEIISSEPFSNYKETVQMKSSKLAMSKSPNKHNRLYVSAEPLTEGLSEMIEDGKSISTTDIRPNPKLLYEEFRWDQDDAKKIWCFGPQNIGANFLVDCTNGTQFIGEIKDSLVSGFHWSTENGVLCEENVRGVRFNIINAYLHSDAIHRGGGQIIPTSRRAFYGAFLLSKPTLQEAILLVDIQCPKSANKGVYESLNTRRGVVISEEPVNNTAINLIKAYMPVSESFGFAKSLRENTGGSAFPQLIFDHWATIHEDSLEPGSRIYEIITQTRARKGLNTKIPSLDMFIDKL